MRDTADTHMIHGHAWSKVNSVGVQEKLMVYILTEIIYSQCSFLSYSFFSDNELSQVHTILYFCLHKQTKIIILSIISVLHHTRFLDDLNSENHTSTNFSIKQLLVYTTKSYTLFSIIMMYTYKMAYKQ